MAVFFETIPRCDQANEAFARLFDADRRAAAAPARLNMTWAAAPDGKLACRFIVDFLGGFRDLGLKRGRPAPFAQTSLEHPCRRGPGRGRRTMNQIPAGGIAAGVLDPAHLGDIRGAFGTIRQHDHAPAQRAGGRSLPLWPRSLGPGLIVMAGDNDAGAFATYTQAGQNYGTALLWTLLLLIPVLYVNQEMVLRLGAVTGVGHARLIFERFGKLWGAFSVIDLFMLNALTIVTEFIGISLALDYLGVSKIAGVAMAAVLTIAAASTGDFRRFERFAILLCVGSFLLVPIFLMAHPPVAVMARDLAIPRLPEGKLSDIMLLVIGIVGTTIAPWQLFFQQSYVIDKRITPRFMRYERADLWLGIVLVMIGAIAMMAFSAAAFEGTPEAGNFTDAGGIAAGLAAHVGPTAGVLFAIALIDAAILGAAAVSLATAYAIGDVFSARHSLHRKPSEAIGFYLVYAGLIAAAAALVLLPERAARPHHRGRADARRRAAAERHGVPAAAVQRPRGAGALGEQPADEPVHRRGDRDSGSDVGDPDRLGAVPRYFRHDDPRHARGWLRPRGRARRRDDAAAEDYDGSRARRRSRNPRHVAHAAAGDDAGATHLARGPHLDDRYCAATLSLRA